MRLAAEQADHGIRLDQFLARKLPEISRARLQEWIKAGRVRVEGTARKASHRLRGGEWIEVEPEARAPLRAIAEEIPLEILYEDDELVAVNKPAGMTVHAGAGRTRGTLVNALLHHFAQLSGVGGDLRPGIVHRLDRLTSGVLLVAKTDTAHLRLAEQFAGRQVRKIYLALVHGKAPDSGRLEMPIRRDRRQRVKMTARAREGRAAVTDFRRLEQWPEFSWLEVRIATGRTHQIRVHLAAVGHPVVGDTLYGAPAQPALDRYFLHAAEVAFAHPGSGQTLEVRAPLPDPLEHALDELRAGGSKLVRR